MLLLLDALTILSTNIYCESERRSVLRLTRTSYLMIIVTKLSVHLVYAILQPLASEAKVPLGFYSSTYPLALSILCKSARVTITSRTKEIDIAYRYALGWHAT